MKYQRIRLLIIILVSAFVMQGCIEITEEVNVNEDASGSISLSVNAGGGSPLLALLGHYADVNLAGELKDNARQVMWILKSQEGISNVKLSQGKRKGSIELSFDFKDDKSLNNALYAAAGSRKTFWQPAIYKINDHRFVRKNTTRWMMKLLKQEEDKIPDESLFDLVEVRSVYHMPAEAGKVKSSDEVKASADMRTFSTSHFLSDLVDDKINTRIKIRY